MAAKHKAKGNARFVTVVATILAVCVVAGVAGGFFLSSNFGKITDAGNAHAVQPATPAAESKTVDNPVDFTALQKQNPDIFAWIYVPGTDVNYPVAQHPSDNAYYLNHSVDGEELVTGTIYAELCNATDLSDPATILYGHNSTDGTMFSTLHSFEDPAFFDEHDVMYMYAPGHVLTYDIVSAYVTTDEHLMHKYDFFSTDESILKFEKDLKKPQSVSANVRKGVQMDVNDRFVVLSTCNSTALGESNRYLVVGMLTNDQPAE